MTDYPFRSELSPDSLVYTGIANLPASSATPLCSLTMVGDTAKKKVGALEIYFESSASGTLTMKRTIGATNHTITLNYGNPVTAGGNAIQVVTFQSGETIEFFYSATSGTYYLTLADVSGDVAKMVRG